MSAVTPPHVHGEFERCEDLVRCGACHSIIGQVCPGCGGKGTTYAFDAICETCGGWGFRKFSADG